MKKIDMTPVKSSSISEVGYDPESRTLHVKFKTGASYEHTDVPPEKYVALTGTESAGKFYNTKIRPAHAVAKLKG